MRSEKLAVTPVEQVGEAIAIEMRERRDGGAVHYALREHALVDAVIIPGVVRSHLVRPRSHPSVRIAGEERGGPFVVARPLRGIPRSRVSAPVIDQVELGIVGIPAPGGAAAELPLVVGPGLEARIPANQLLGGSIDGLVGIEQDVCVGTDAIRAPNLLSGFEIVRGEMAAAAVLSLLSCTTSGAMVMVYRA